MLLFLFLHFRLMDLSKYLLELVEFECLVHQQVTNASIVLQCAFRMRIAKRMIRRLKREAKDTHLIAQERDRLRVELKQMKLELEKMKVDDSQSQSEEIRQLYQRCAKKDQELQELREQLANVEFERAFDGHHSNQTPSQHSKKKSPSCVIL